MKKVKFLVLLVLLIAVVATGMPHRQFSTHVLCDTSDDPSLCIGGHDTGCRDFCLGSLNCSDFGTIHGACLPAGANWVCKCTGTNP
jgi:hypothetical protein